MENNEGRTQSHTSIWLVSCGLTVCLYY